MGKSCQSLSLQNGSACIVMAPGNVLIRHVSTHLRKFYNEILARSYGDHWERLISATRVKEPWGPMSELWAIDLQGMCHPEKELSVSSVNKQRI